MSKLKLIMPKILSAIGAIALIASLSFSGITIVQKRDIEVQYKAQSDRVAALEAQAKQLKLDKKDDEAKLKSLGDQVAALLPENSSLKDNVGAFAEQAAVCEKIRQTLKLGT
jgi:hypothetical protein